MVYKNWSRLLGYFTPAPTSPHVLHATSLQNKLLSPLNLSHPILTFKLSTVRQTKIMDSERWTAPLLVSYLNAGISLLFVQNFPHALNCIHSPKLTRKLNFIHLPNSYLNLKFSHLIILFSFQYVCPSRPPRPRTQRGNYTSQHET